MPTPTTSLLRADIGSSTVLARAGEHRCHLWVLDESSSALWDVLHRVGVDRDIVTRELARNFGMTVEAAGSYLSQLDDSWRAAGLLETDGDSVAEPPPPPVPMFEDPRHVQPQPDAWWLTVADRRVVVEVDDDELRTVLQPLFSQLADDDTDHRRDAIADEVALSGSTTGWQLRINGVETGSGHDGEAALVFLLEQLSYLGCRTRERLFVIHGAGLISPDGRGLLMTAPGGSGKSTLAIALEAEGFQLLNDDLVPIRMDGAALGLGLPACLKQGSWPVLARLRPDLAQAITVHRYERPVRFLVSPRNHPTTRSVMPSRLVFPSYQPEAAPTCTPVSAEQALCRLIESGAGIGNPTQQNLEALCRWVSAIPAYALTYPDLDAGLSLVRRVMDNHTPAS